MNYQHAHPKFFMAVAILLALAGAVFVAAGIATFGGSRVSYSTNFGGHTTESWVLLFSGILCVLFGVSRAFYLGKLLADQRKNSMRNALNHQGATARRSLAGQSNGSEMCQRLLQPSRRSRRWSLDTKQD